MVAQQSNVRLTQVLDGVGIRRSSWYYQAVPSSDRRRPGPSRASIPQEVVDAIVQMATDNPWYGYQKIAVMCRRADGPVTDRMAYRVMADHGLLQKRRSRQAEIHQASKLYELLPHGPNDLWQTDVTYVHIPGHGWWYAVTVIDYYSRYLLACYLTTSYSAIHAVHALKLAREEAERICGRLKKQPFLVTDNGPSFIAKRFRDFVKDTYSQVRIQYRTPTQLGLLERFHRTLKQEEIYWRLYDSPAHARQCLEEFRERYNTLRPHWALIPQAGGDPLTPYEVYVSGQAIRIPKWQRWAKGAKAKLDRLMAEESAA